MKKLNNRGFTLAELIVVVAIMGILAGVMSASINHIFSNKTRKFVNECDAMLTRCRVEILSGARQNDTYVDLGLKNGQYYVAFYKNGTQEELEVLKNGNATCTYTMQGEAATQVQTESALKLNFDRSTGALTKKCVEINVSGSKITLEPATGYHQTGG